uniref:Protealysin propeptide n=2 Tax=unclassified Caudoviricetes TaxID=2788787 RepID=A0A8S5UN44_9CAUD|nr:MAG TPA: Protealysin propeptide [Siphoviridae sp. ctsus30]DAF95834.1 MAG TPA: Protealysin propeptide [Siphoviridae sp. ctKGQ3]
MCHCLCLSVCATQPRCCIVPPVGIEPTLTLTIKRGKLKT